jgi:hypothetical protein
VERGPRLSAAEWAEGEAALEPCLFDMDNGSVGPNRELVAFEVAADSLDAMFPTVGREGCRAVLSACDGDPEAAADMLAEHAFGED